MNSRIAARTAKHLGMRHQTQVRDTHWYLGHFETAALIARGGVKKGDVLSIAQLAGIMGAKKTPDLIPLCHPLLLSHIHVTCTPNEVESRVDIEATVRLRGKTGVEMEALTAVSVAGLTIYDMAKAVDRGMRIDSVRVVHKSSGQSDICERGRRSACCRSAAFV